MSLSSYRGLAIAMSLAAGLLIGCSKATAPARPSAASSVRIHNASSVDATNIRVATGENDAFTIDVLKPGETSTVHAILEMHTNPSIVLVTGGQTLASLPTEGFAGFNPLLPAGEYSIDLQIDVAAHRLLVTTAALQSRSGL